MFPVDVYGRSLGRIDGCQNDVGTIFPASHNVFRIGNNERVQLVDTYVSFVDVIDEGVQRFAFGIPHVALYFRQNGYGGDYRHIFEQRRFPHGGGLGSVARVNGGRKVVFDRSSFDGVGHETADEIAVVVYFLSQFHSLLLGGGQHDV